MRRTVKTIIRAELTKRLASPWDLAEWKGDYAIDDILVGRLRRLDDAFPRAWRQELIRRCESHPLVSDLMWNPSRARLLALADVLKYKSHRHNPQSEIWMGGKLRDPKQYCHTSSELLAEPLLSAFGRVLPQPALNRLGCDFLVAVPSSNVYLGVEVKSLRESQRSVARALAFRNANPGYSGAHPLPSAEMEQYEVQRIKRRVRHAADQLDAASRDLRNGALFLGILFLDLGSNGYIPNHASAIIEWINAEKNRSWAGSIDTVVMVDHVLQKGGWGTIARVEATRSDAFMKVAESSLGSPCIQGHLHSGARLDGGQCDYKFI